MVGETTSLFIQELNRETTPGNYFISNYPPYSFWKPENVRDAYEAIERVSPGDNTLGIYLHIPFCRKRCHFCYFKIYTGKKETEIQHYLDAAIRELTLYSQKPFINERRPRFVYFGGGTPSYLSSRQLAHLTDAMKQLLPWSSAEEVTFECEPGTLTEAKLKVIREIGVTRLSLGIENFNDRILEGNGRAHGSKEIYRAYDFARSVAFPQINIDLIAGMVGETNDNWQECVRRTIALQPDSVTIYQMEIPYNTTISKEMEARGEKVAPVGSWKNKRDWVGSAFGQLEEAGYTVTSAYTAVRDPAQSHFIYRDQLWSGADLIGLGVASFSYVGGTHFQNDHDFDRYLSRLQTNDLPIYRSLTPSPEERMIREFILQMKLGRVDGRYFESKFGVNIQQQFFKPLQLLQGQGFLMVDSHGVRLNRSGLLLVDRLLYEFFLPEHRTSRYT